MGRLFTLCKYSRVCGVAVAADQVCGRLQRFVVNRKNHIRVYSYLKPLNYIPQHGAAVCMWMHEGIYVEYSCSSMHAASQPLHSMHWFVHMQQCCECQGYAKPNRI